MTFQSLTCRTKNDMRLMHPLQILIVLHRLHVLTCALFSASQQTCIEKDHMLRMPATFFITHQRLQRLHRQILLLFHLMSRSRPLVLHGFMLWQLRKKHFSPKWTNLSWRMTLSSMCIIYREIMSLHKTATTMQTFIHL